jgi:hypothetical protein
MLRFLPDIASLDQLVCLKLLADALGFEIKQQERPKKSTAPPDPQARVARSARRAEAIFPEVGELVRDAHECCGTVSWSSRRETVSDRVLRRLHPVPKRHAADRCRSCNADVDRRESVMSFARNRVAIGS